MIGGVVAAVGAAAVLAGKGGDGAAGSAPAAAKATAAKVTNAVERRRLPRGDLARGAGPVLLVVAARGRAGAVGRGARGRRGRLGGVQGEAREPRHRPQRAARHAARGLVRLALLVAGPRHGGVQQGLVHGTSVVELELPGGTRLSNKLRHNLHQDRRRRFASAAARFRSMRSRCAGLKTGASTASIKPAGPIP